MRHLPAAPGLYLITCKVEGRLPIYYVGQSSDVRRRLNQHRSALRRSDHYNRKMQAYWSRYGELVFSFELLGLHQVSELDVAEAWWLDFLAGHDRSFNFGTDPAASNRGRKFTPEHRAKIAQAHTGANHYNFGCSLSQAHRDAISAGGKGKKRSPSTRDKISAANKGSKNSMFGKIGQLNPRSKPVKGVHRETGEVREYASAQLAEFDGFSQPAISKVCNGRWPHHRNYVWQFVV